MSSLNFDLFLKAFLSTVKNDDLPALKFNHCVITQNISSCICWTSSRFSVRPKNLFRIYNLKIYATSAKSIGFFSAWIESVTGPPTESEMVNFIYASSLHFQ